MKKLAEKAVLLAAFVSMGANAAVIDFESTSLGVYTSLSFSDATLTYTGGSGTFQIVSASPGAPVAGKAAISSFNNPGPAPFLLSFSSAMDYVQVGVGDYNADADNSFMEAFDSLDNLVGSASFANLASTYGGGFMTVAAPNISYVKFWDGEPYPGAVYWDSITYERSRAAVPEPAALALLGFGLAGLALTRRRGKA